MARLKLENSANLFHYLSKEGGLSTEFFGRYHLFQIYSGNFQMQCQLDKQFNEIHVTCKFASEIHCAYNTPTEIYKIDQTLVTCSEKILDHMNAFSRKTTRIGGFEK